MLHHRTHQTRDWASRLAKQVLILATLEWKGEVARREEREAIQGTRSYTTGTGPTGTPTRSVGPGGE